MASTNHIHMHWVKGHSNNIYNDEADKAADDGKYGVKTDIPRHADQCNEHFATKWILGADPTHDLATTDLNSIHNITEATEALNKALHLAASNSFKRQTIQPRTFWIIKDTLSLTSRPRVAHENDKTAEFHSLQKQIRKQARKDKRLWLHTKVDELVSQDKEWQGVHFAKKKKYIQTLYYKRPRNSTPNTIQTPDTN